MKKLSILALTATIATAPAFAETTVYQTIPSTTPSIELSTQTTQTTDLSFAFEDAENLQTKEMTTTEMQETEGAVAPLVAIGVIHGGRFIAQRWVTQRVASAALSKGANIYARNSQQAKAIANQAWGRQNIIRHGKKELHSNYSHYQHTNQKYRGHAFYGKRHR
ncbi:hypothetical protein [Moraxella bovoculi]|uniref:hypothetical protein n=1 Tax=Moraxella bovoculi TaxID=386891 RepID=UPI001968B63C|nr:hypothetical protein [Moraxella bovoculi]